jgi:hypothetical protein
MTTNNPKVEPRRDAQLTRSTPARNPVGAGPGPQEQSDQDGGPVLLMSLAIR